MSDTDNKSSMNNENLVQFLTVSYNPSSHPKQICLLDPNGQSILYTLIPGNQSISPSMFSQGGSHNIGAIQNRIVCFICGLPAVEKCGYESYGTAPCGRLLCLEHVMEMQIGNGRCFVCPEHFEQRCQCNIL